MVKKLTPYRFKLSCRPPGLDPGTEEFAQAKFGPTEVEWINDDLVGLSLQPCISHNMYKGRKVSYGNWVGMQSAIMTIPMPEAHEFDDRIAELADRLECDVCGYGVPTGMRIIIPFDRIVDDPDDRDIIKAYLMSKIGIDAVAAFSLETVYSQERNGGFGYTFHQGPMKVDEVLTYVPEPDYKIALPISTAVETLEGKMVTLETIEPDTKFICPVCKDHKLPAPDGMNIVEQWERKPSRFGYYCPWCQVLKNNRTGGIEVEPQPRKRSTSKS